MILPKKEISYYKQLYIYIYILTVDRVFQYHYSHGVQSVDYPRGNKRVENLGQNELIYVFKSSTTLFYVLASLVYK